MIVRWWGSARKDPVSTRYSYRVTGSTPGQLRRTALNSIADTLTLIRLLLGFGELFPDGCCTGSLSAWAGAVETSPAYAKRTDRAGAPVEDCRSERDSRSTEPRY